MCPGQRMMQGSRTPPSKLVSFPFAQSAGRAAMIAVNQPRPVVAGEDHQRPLGQSLLRSRASMIWPTDQSISITTSPNRPEAALPLNLSEA